MKNTLLQSEINARINLRGRREADGFFKEVDKKTWNSHRRINWEIEVLRKLKSLKS